MGHSEFFHNIVVIIGYIQVYMNETLLPIVLAGPLSKATKNGTEVSL
jgi:hypothetical protein